MNAHPRRFALIGALTFVVTLALTLAVTLIDTPEFGANAKVLRRDQP
jgi:hypothetical protein